jgi:hypothetical protein
MGEHLAFVERHHSETINRRPAGEWQGLAPAWWASLD